ncbi:MAG: hypothetical protein ACRDAU_05305 [Clostridium sp.]
MILKFTVDDNYKKAYENKFKKNLNKSTKSTYLLLGILGLLFIASLFFYINTITKLHHVTFISAAFCTVSITLFIGALYIYIISSKKTIQKFTKYNFAKEPLSDFEDFLARYDLPTPKKSNMSLVYVYFEDNFLVEEKFSSKVYHKLRNFKEIYEDNSCLIISCKNNFIIVPLSAFKDNAMKKEFIKKVSEIGSIDHEVISLNSTKMLSYLNLLNTSHYIEGVFLATILFPVFLVVFRYDILISIILLIFIVFINKDVFRKIHNFDFKNSSYLRKASFNCIVTNHETSVSVETNFYIIHLKKDCLTIKNLDAATILLNEDFNLVLNTPSLS